MEENVIAKAQDQAQAAANGNRDKSKIYFFIIAIMALLATNVYFYVKYKSSGERLYTLTLQKEKLQIEIDRIEAELDNIDRMNIQEIPSSISEQQDRARQVIAELRKALEDSEVTDRNLIEANAQLELLKSNVSKLMSEINDLRLQNEMLKKENTELQHTVRQAHSKVEKLEQDNISLNEKVVVASSLKVSSITVDGVEKKRNGNLQVQPKAKKADFLQIKFTIADNPLAKKGKKVIFGRVIDPQGNLVASSSDEFYIQGDKMNYSFKESINFTNNGEEYQFLWQDPNGKLKKGAYTVLLYVDDAIMGRASALLK